MLSILINFIFTILSKISDLILTPVFSVIGALIPGFAEFSTSMAEFLSNGISYFSFVCKLFMIPQVCLTATVSLALTYITIRLAITTYLFLVRTWKTLKP